jgi:hypothetical protein
MTKGEKRHGCRTKRGSLLVFRSFAAQNSMAKIRRDADALGRHGCRLFPIPGVFAEQNPKPKSGTEAAALGRQDAGCNHSLQGIGGARSGHGASRRGRSVAEPWQPTVALIRQPRSGVVQPFPCSTAPKRLIARFFATQPQKMRPTYTRYPAFSNLFQTENRGALRGALRALLHFSLSPAILALWVRGS